MKKRICAVLTVCLTIALFFSSQAVLAVRAEDGDFVQDTDEVDLYRKRLIEDYGKEFVENMDRAYENCDALMALFPIDAYGEPVEPDFLGGIYYNDDGNMVLQLVTDAQTTDVALRTAVDNLIEERNIIVEYVEFSHNEITATIDTLNAITDERPEIFDRIDSFGESTSNNRVEVDLRVYNEEEIAWFRETVLDSPILAFVQSSGPIVPLSDFYSLPSGGTTANVSSDSNLFAYLPWIVVLCIGLLIGSWFVLSRRQARPVPAGVNAEGAGSTRQCSCVSKKQVVAAIKDSDCVPREDLLTDILEKMDEVH